MSFSPLSICLASAELISLSHLSIPPKVSVMHKGQGIFFPVYACYFLLLKVRSRREINREGYVHKLSLPACFYCIVKEFWGKRNCTSAAQVFFIISNQTVLKPRCSNLSEWLRTNEVARRPNVVYPESSEGGMNLDPAV